MNSPKQKVHVASQYSKSSHSKDKKTGFYTKLNVLGSLGLNFDYYGGPIIENGGPIFLYIHIISFNTGFMDFRVLISNKSRTLEVSTSFREGIQTALSCQTGVAKHQIIFVSQPFVST